MGIRAVIFDLDHTLYNFMDCHERADHAVGQYVEDHFGIGYDSYHQKVVAAMRKTEEKIGVINASSHSRTLRYQTFLEEIGAPAIDHAYPMRQLYWNSFYDQMILEPSVERTLAALQETGARILIATDMTCGVQLEKIRILGISRYLDFLVTSEEAGEEKPGKRILDLCVKKAGVPKEECVFVGDHPKKDVLGPMDYGMQGVWCRHFDPERFMRSFGITVDESMTEGISYRLERFEDCVDENGKLKSLGGLQIQ
ncbi:MAG: HAD family hydrolase [Lachnospiraceae bacterium]|nr:HAD family hydrolase [Lachnospiraceae bacterium]